MVTEEGLYQTTRSPQDGTHESPFFGRLKYSLPRARGDPFGFVVAEDKTCDSAQTDIEDNRESFHDERNLKLGSSALSYDFLPVRTFTARASGPDRGPSRHKPLVASPDRTRAYSLRGAFREAIFAPCSRNGSSVCCICHYMLYVHGASGAQSDANALSSNQLIWHERNGATPCCSEGGP